LRVRADAQCAFKRREAGIGAKVVELSHVA
jgi:hypothetical protein